MTPIDLSRARADTPGVRNVLHFNNAGAALMPRPVLDAVRDYVAREGELGGYETAKENWDRVEHAYDALARLVGAAREEIAVVENATRAWDMLFYSFKFGPDDRILTCETEYASNYLAYLQVARNTGCTVEAVPSDESGAVSVDALRERIDGRVKLIAVSHVPTNGGLVNPAAEIGAVAREAGVPFLLDACQSAGQMPLDVDAIGCDMLTATSRKYLRGPRGVGFLYVRQGLIETLEPPFVDLHAAEWTGPDEYRIRADARRFETWECNWAGKVGLAVAVDYALDWGLDAIEARVTALAGRLRGALSSIPDVTLRDLGTHRCGIVSFTVNRHDPAAIQQAMADQAINIGLSPANFTLLDMDRRGLGSVARASVHYYNSEAEVDRFAAAIESLTLAR
ncbi:MAG: aminotransferase class V-fold PLP-dependent enzyme [Bauldia litoralis]